MSNNRLNYLHDQILPHNLELQIIDFIINLIPVSPQKTFIGNTELRSINLRANRITQISPGTFHTNKNITDLDLSHNKIQELNDDLFAETQIKTLNLRGNDLTMRGNVPLLKAPLLEKLDLGMCGITALPPKTIQGMLQLKELFLVNNSLSLLTEAGQKKTTYSQIYIAYQNWICLATT
jgi:Leucine-rich repeat (LRR) protein